MGEKIADGCDQPHPVWDGRELWVVAAGCIEVRVIVGHQHKVEHQHQEARQGQQVWCNPQRHNLTTTEKQHTMITWV